MLFFLALETLNESDRDFVESIFLRYGKKIKAYSQFLLKNYRADADADDAVNDTMMRVIRNRGTLGTMNESEIKKHIIIYTRSACFDILRKRMRIDIVSTSDVFENDNGEKKDMDLADDLDMLKDIITKDSVKFLAAAINDLESPACEIIKMKYYQEKRNVEIADELGLETSTVGTIIHRTTQKLRKLMEDNGYGKNQ